MSPVTLDTVVLARQKAEDFALGLYRARELAQLEASQRIVVIHSPSFFYRGPMITAEDAFSLHWQVEPHPVQIKVEYGDSVFVYKGDARNFAAAHAAWRDHMDEAPTQKAPSRAPSFFQKAVRLVRSLFQ
jgi:hypothetical protein